MRNLGRGEGDNCPLPVFFLPKNSFLLATELNRGKIKNGAKVEERGVCIIK
jgi:hypothetical protein